MARQTGLRGRVVIITGAAAGIGRATALRFAEEGSTVVVWDTDEPRGTDLIPGLKGAGGDGCFIQVDVSVANDVERATAQVMSRFHRVDVLINNAGIVRDAQLVKWKENKVHSILTEEDWDDVNRVDLKGVFLCTRAVVPHMIAGGGGVVLNAASVVGLHGNFGQTNYVAAKAGVIGMTRVWARELGKYNIRVNTVAPGFVATEILQSVPPKILQGMIDHTPLGRAGTPEDLAEAYLWLASDAAGFVHGAVLSVDGGIVVGT
jgi:3-oxoacyl-[acyl-carrier protein] reductase